MLKFFRIIRQNLVTENKFSKYLLYAIGEIILVVIGILIALSINNWNNKRAEQIKEQHYLTGFNNDIKRQLRLLTELQVTLSKKIEFAESILADYETTESLTKIDSFSFKISNLMTTSLFPNINTTFDEIISSGLLGVIQNDSLRLQIIDFYQKNDEAEYSYHTNIRDVFYPLIFPDFKSSIQINLKDFGYSSKKINHEGISIQHNAYLKSKLEDYAVAMDIINGLSLRILFTQVNKNTVTISKKDCELLAASIEHELQKFGRNHTR